MYKTILVVFIIVLMACGQADTTKPVVVTTKDSIAVAPTYGVEPTSFYNSMLKAYESYILGLDSFDVTSKTKAVTQFKTLFGNEPIALCDSAYVIFNRLNAKMVNALNISMEKDTTLIYDSLGILNEDGSRPVLSKKLQDFQQSLAINGFRITQEEGISYVVSDGDFVAKSLYQMLSPTMVIYLEQVNRQDKEGFASDASIVISPQVLVDRIVWKERFLSKNTNFLYAATCFDDLVSYMNVLLGQSGLDNLRFYDNDGKTLTEYFEEAFVYLNKQYPQSQANKVSYPIYQAIKSGQTEKVKQLQAAYKKLNGYFRFKKKLTNILKPQCATQQKLNSITNVG